MRNIKLLIEYDGSNYSGWQFQENAISIQETIQDAIKKVTGESVKLIGSGRTDAKVHALGQVANFLTNSTIPGDRFKYALNIKLPDDITILESEEVSLDFHSRFSATYKKYKYLIYNNEIPSALLRNYTFHVKEELNIEDMKKAARFFIGTHDFASFMATRSDVKTTVRTIYDVRINKNKEIIEVVVEGNSFLRNMIRIIIGTLVEVGKGKIKIFDIEKIILSKNRMAAGPTAPPQGLYLERVFYDEIHP